MDQPGKVAGGMFTFIRKVGKNKKWADSFAKIKTEYAVK